MVQAGERIRPERGRWRLATVALVWFLVLHDDTAVTIAVPGVLLNRWVQLALMTPVMFCTGGPVPRIGWLTLAHPGADMSSPQRTPGRSTA